jgi:hypothetical protein
MRRQTENPDVLWEKGFYMQTAVGQPHTLWMYLLANFILENLMQLMQPLLVLALAFSVVAGAHADNLTFNMGTLSSTPYVNTRTVTAGTVFTLPSTGTTPYNFTDTYNFTVTSSPSVASTGVTINLDLGSLSFHISNMRLDLFNASSWMAGDSVTGPTDYSVSVNSTLSPGNYYFLFRGLADGTATNQGIYTLTAAAAAVPEAETYAMMLAGLGLVAFMGMVRRKSLKAVS